MLTISSVFGQKVQDVPRFNSDAEKKAWIAAHPEEYARVSGEKVSPVTERNAVKKSTPEFKTQAEKDAWVKSQHAKNDPASISTEAQKDAWLKEHPSAIYMTQEEFNALPEGKKASVRADKNFVIIK
jgi:hypothetical protein